MIKALRTFTICFINYFVVTKISSQINLLFFAIDKLNFRLMRAFQYFSQFTLNIRHRLNKFNIVSNVLLKLTIDVKKNNEFDEKALNEVEIYNNETNVIIVDCLITQVVKKENNAIFQQIFNDAISFHFYLLQMSNDFRQKLLDVYIKSI